MLEQELKENAPEWLLLDASVMLGMCTCTLLLDDDVRCVGR